MYLPVQLASYEQRKLFFHIGLILMFSLQSAILSVILESERPIRKWKTESDLWHNPRKYIVPLIMLIMTSFIISGKPAVQIWSALLLAECCILLYYTKRIMLKSEDFQNEYGIEYRAGMLISRSKSSSGRAYKSASTHSSTVLTF